MLDCALTITRLFAETRAHDFPDLWPNVNDPAKEHPNSPRVVQILEVYRRLYKATGKEQPLLKNASFISPEEALAAGEMGCHSATISHTVLNELASRIYDETSQPGRGVPKTALQYRSDSPAVPARLQSLLTIDPLRSDGKLQFGLEEAVKIDYLADGGKALDAAIAADPAAKKRLEVALELFTGGENRSKEKVEKALAAL